MFAVIDGINEANSEAVADQAAHIMTAEIRRFFVERGKDEAVDFTEARDADGATVEDAFGTFGGFLRSRLSIGTWGATSR